MIFPKWVNQIIPVVVAAVILGGGAALGFYYYFLQPEHLEVGYMPEQPVQYSHELHVSQLGMDCRYCHYTVENAAHAAIPPTEVCMNCHGIIKTDSKLTLPIRESMVNGEPIEWVRVHMLPDYAYFDHSRHINAGVSCVSCHGRVDKMEVVHQVEPLSMRWCLECHREPEKHLRPMDKITDLGWQPENQIETGLLLKEQRGIQTKEDCSTCHR